MTGRPSLMGWAAARSSCLRAQHRASAAQKSLCAGAFPPTGLLEGGVCPDQGRDQTAGRGLTDAEPRSESRCF